MSNMDYSLVVPVYKSTSTLLEIARRAKAVFASMQASYELIFVNDSPFYEPTDNVLRRLVEEDQYVHYIRFTRNFGQQPATLCGIAHSSGEHIITMDDDLQHAPEDICELIKEKDTHEVVIAMFTSKEHSYFKRVASNVKGYFDYLLIGKPKHVKLSSFRLISRNIVDHMQKIKTPYPFIPALIFSVTDDVVNVVTTHRERKEGESGYTLRKMISVFSNLLINNSSFLLKLIGFLGIASFCLATVVGCYILYKKIVYDIAVIGWSSTMIALLFLGGLNLLAVGIIGEYLIRIITTSEDRPTYFIDKVY